MGRSSCERPTAAAVDRSLIFLLRAVTATVTLHVLDTRDGLPHTPMRHEQATGQVLGFYSTQHRGVFTPRDSDLHMHVRTADGRMSGHVERIALEPGVVIAVPRNTTR